jgi:hypothetical protein
LYDIVVVNDPEKFFNHLKPVTTRDRIVSDNPMSHLKISASRKSKQDFLAGTSVIHFASPKVDTLVFRDILRTGIFDDAASDQNAQAEAGIEEMKSIIRGLESAFKVTASAPSVEPKFLGRVKYITSGCWARPIVIPVDGVAENRRAAVMQAITRCQVLYFDLIAYIEPKIYCQHFARGPMTMGILDTQRRTTRSQFNHHLSGSARSIGSVNLSRGQINRIFIHHAQQFDSPPIDEDARLDKIQSFRCLTDLWRGESRRMGSEYGYQLVDRQWLKRKPLKHDTQVEIYGYHGAIPRPRDVPMFSQEMQEMFETLPERESLDACYLSEARRMVARERQQAEQTLRADLGASWKDNLTFAPFEDTPRCEACGYKPPFEDWEQSFLDIWYAVLEKHERIGGY